MHADETAIDAFEVFSVSRLRARIIRLTLAHGEVTAAMLLKELQVSRSAITRHVRDLVAAGILHQFVRPASHQEIAQGGANALLWSVNRDMLEQWSTQLHHDLTTPESVQQD